MKSKKIKIILPLVVVLGLVNYHYGDKMESNFNFNLENLLAVPTAMAENGSCNQGSCNGNGNWTGAYPKHYSYTETRYLGMGIDCTRLVHGISCLPSSNENDWCDEEHYVGPWNCG